MLGNPVEHIQNVDVIKKFKFFFGEFTGLDLEIIHIDHQGSFYSGKNKLKSKTKCGEHFTDDCSNIQPSLLEEILTSKTSRVFNCPNKLMRLAVPILLNGEVAGLFIVSENGVSRIDPAKRETLSLFLSEMGRYVLQNESAFLQNYKGVTSTHKQQLLEKVLRYVRNNCHDQKLTLKQVVMKNGVSYCYLSRLFKNELNTTFVEYRQKVRMSLAAKLMMDLRMTVDQVARSCSFEDASYFSKSFKKIFGCTPGSFRRRFITGKKARKVDAFIKKQTAIMMTGATAPRLISASSLSS